MDPISRAQNNDKTDLPRKIGKPWPKGVSGNPGGRPKRKHLTEMLQSIVENPDMLEAIRSNTAKTLSSKGMAGVLMLREAMDRLEGRVQDNVNITGEISLSLANTIQERRKKRGKHASNHNSE